MHIVHLRALSRMLQGRLGASCKCSFGLECSTLEIAIITTSKEEQDRQGRTGFRMLDNNITRVLLGIFYKFAVLCLIFYCSHPLVSLILDVDAQEEGVPIGTSSKQCSTFNLLAEQSLSSSKNCAIFFIKL